ncbi:hypothetical protein O181_116831 [Austropuccinia psidii MF-1]|uniref:Uncharacterized protein n=1 Tax=Austropuccinia psidii MF-1 TaxID=1389203 RepID=A0A9Q3PXF3_9BASI|nr:hypothetical protein [Austropuccinia psidii MF-1]
MMVKADKSSRKRMRVLPKVPIASKNADPPKGLPIDFYNLKWFKLQNAMHKRTIPDWRSVAFLPNPEESLEVNPHPDQKLSDKLFNKKFHEATVQSYPIPDEEHSEDNLDGKDEESSINLEAPSANKDEEDDCYAPGEYAYEDDEATEEEENSEVEEENHSDDGDARMVCAEDDK